MAQATLFLLQTLIESNAIFTLVQYGPGKARWKDIQKPAEDSSGPGPGFGLMADDSNVEMAEIEESSNANNEISDSK